MAFDVDGVLTDGSLYYTDQGIEIKAFNTLDGQGLKMLQQAGITVAIITGRKSRCVELRAQNLGIRHLFQAVDNKLEVMNSLLAELNLEPDDAGYMGDDVPDLPADDGLRLFGHSKRQPFPGTKPRFVHQQTLRRPGSGT
jgi:3-deoxy-D-manno-octulosonate 8-phosphate phosphatase (KDO 8-P phosphatase)